MLVKDARKGRLVYVAGKMQTRRWRKDGEDSDPFSTESLLVPGSRIQFLNRANGNAAPGRRRHPRTARQRPPRAARRRSTREVPL